MIYQKTNPIGLDALIHVMQSKLYNELNTLWSIELEAFERCYILEKDGKKEVKRFVKSKEYETVSVAEKNKFFFLHRAKSTKKDALYYDSELELVFILDLTKIKVDIEHRADYEVQNDVENIITQFNNVWIKSLESGYDRALQGISYDQQNDMQPYHIFKFTLGVTYTMSDTINDLCCC